MFKPVSANATDIKKDLGKPYVGTYVGKDEITTKIGPQSIYKFIGENDIPFSIYGFTNLNRYMGSIKEGHLCRITYTGTQKMDTKYGKNKDVHQVLVEVDDADVAPAEEKGEEVPF